MAIDIQTLSSVFAATCGLAWAVFWVARLRSEDARVESSLRAQIERLQRRLDELDQVRGLEIAPHDEPVALTYDYRRPIAPTVTDARGRG